MRTMLLHRKSAAPLTPQSDVLAWWRRHDECFVWRGLDGNDSVTEAQVMRDEFVLHPLAVVLTAMRAIVVLQLWIFRRKKWI